MRSKGTVSPPERHDFKLRRLNHIAQQVIDTMPLKLGTVEKIYCRLSKYNFAILE